MRVCAASVRSDGATAIGYFSENTSPNPNRRRQQASETGGKIFLLFLAFFEKSCFPDVSAPRSPPKASEREATPSPGDSNLSCRSRRWLRGEAIVPINLLIPALVGSRMRFEQYLGFAKMRKGPKTAFLGLPAAPLPLAPQNKRTQHNTEHARGA